jgi:hypothetical protein
MFEVPDELFGENKMSAEWAKRPDNHFDAGEDVW